MKASTCWICALSLGSALLCAPILVSAQSDTETSTPPAGATSAESPQNSGMSQRTGMNPRDNRNEAGLTTTDQKFVRDAAEGGLAEVELGRLAVEKGSSESVKKFGQRMVDDHSKANDELKQIASAKGVDLPTNLSAKDKMLKEHLSKLSGPNFDKAYMEDMVRDHKKDVADFARESSAGGDTQVKQFATKTLPTLKEHLKKAEDIAPSAKTSSSGGAAE
jgi:putative membrane protein